MSDCVFCKIVSGEIPSFKIYEDKNLVAFLDHAPVKVGHTLVIPKKHCDTFVGLADEILFQIVVAIKKIAPAVVKGVEAEGFNLILNSGVAAGQVVFHAHWHIIPRHADDQLKWWASRDYKIGEVDEVLKNIKNFI